MHSRRPGSRPGRRLALAAAAAAVLACVPSPTALADDSNEQVVANVYAPASAPTQDVVSLGALAGCPTYTGPSLELYGPGGALEPAQTVSRDAWTLGTVLSCLQRPIPAADVQGVVIVGPTGPQYGTDSELDPGDLASPSDFADPSESPLIYDDGTGITYARPWRGGEDANAEDNFALSYPSQFTFDVYEGSLLDVALTAPSSIGGGKPVTFEATVSGVPAGATLSYAWDFDGGAPNSTVEDPTVTFSAAGEYRVTLEVTDGDGGGGGASTTVTVGDTGTVPARGSGNPGPTRSSGHHPGGHRGKPTKSSSTRAARHHGRHSTGGSATGGRRGTSTGSGTTTTAPGGTSSGSTATSTAASSTSTAPIAPSPAVAAPPRKTAGRPSGRDGHEPPAAASRGGSEVSGRLLGSVALVPAADSPLVRLAGPQATAPPLRRALSGSPGPAIAAGVAVLLLLALGAGRELGARAAYDPRP
jgi:PKD domain